MSGWVYGPGGGSTSPGGSNGDIQFNSSGSFGGSTLLTTDGAGNLSASANISASAFYGDGSNLTGVTASAVEVADGPQYSLQFRFDSPVSGDLSGSSDLLWDPATSDVLISGNVRLENGKEFYGDLEGAILFPANVDEVGGIGKGKVVYIKGLSGTTPTIGLAACDDPSKMPAFGLCAISASNNANTQVATFGSIDGLNLNNISPGHSFSEGDTLYVNTGSGGTAGTFTNTRPTGSNNLLQNIGVVVRNGISSNGQIKLGGAGRSNATPNLDKGHIFVGDESDCSIQDSTIFVSASAERVGINITVPTAALHVSASSVHGGESARFEGQVVITSPDGELVVQDTSNNKQVRVTADILPTIEFGDNTDTDDFFLIQGGATSKILVDPSLNAFIISDTTAATEGITYKPAQARVGIHTPTPTHAFTVNGDTYVTGAISASVGIEVSSSGNGSISIGEGIIYTYGGLDRLDAFEDTFKLRDVNYYKAISTVQTSNFNIEGFQTFLVDTTGSVITGTLPGLTEDGQIGLTYTIKDYAGSGSTNNVVIEPSGSQEIDGGTAAKIQTNYGAMTLTAFSSSHGYSWGIVSAT